jgi:hypothetical protein
VARRIAAGEVAGLEVPTGVGREPSELDLVLLASKRRHLVEDGEPLEHGGLAGWGQPERGVLCRPPLALPALADHPPRGLDQFGEGGQNRDDMPRRPTAASTSSVSKRLSAAQQVRVGVRSAPAASSKKPWVCGQMVAAIRNTSPQSSKVIPTCGRFTSGLRS